MVSGTIPLSQTLPKDDHVILLHFLSIEIVRADIKEFSESLLGIAAEYNRSCYDASSLALAGILEAPLITGDKKLYHAVKERVPSVTWIEDL